MYSVYKILNEYQFVIITNKELMEQTPIVTTIKGLGIRSFVPLLIATNVKSKCKTKK